MASFKIVVDEDGRAKTVFEDGSYCFNWVPKSARPLTVSAKS